MKFKSTSKCEGITNLLRSFIESKIDEEGEGQIPSEWKLAEIYGVSRNTIREAMITLINEGLLVKKQGKRTFISRSLQAPKKLVGNHICFYLYKGDFFDPYYAKILNGVETELRGSGYPYNVIYSTLEKEIDLDKVEEELSLLKKQNIKGLIVTGELPAPLIYLIKKQNMPFVVIGFLLKKDKIEEEIDRVIFDQVKDVYEITEYLVNLGHKNISLINGPDTQYCNGILEGYERLLSEKGINYENKYLKVCSSYDEKEGYKAMVDLLKLEERPTAVIGAADVITLGTLKAIKDNGFNIPLDISLISFGDNREICAYTEPPLTTYLIPPEELGKKALTVLLNKINLDKSPMTVFIPGKLVVRDSCKRIDWCVKT